MATRNIITPNKVVELSRLITTDTRNPAGPVLNGETSFNSPMGTDRQLGFTLPGWKDKIIRKGGNASTNYTRVVTEYSPAFVSLRASTLNRFMPSYRIDSFERAVLVGNVSGFSSSDTETQQRALAKIKKQLANRVGSASIMAPAGEIKQLGGLVRQTVNLTTDFLSAVAHAKKTRGGSLSKFLASTWLGYNFGMKPLIQDIGSVGNAIATWISRQDNTYRLSATASKEGFISYTPMTAISTVPIGYKWKLNGGARYKLSYRYVGAFDLDIRSSNDYTMLDHLGIGFDQIPATAWELTAFSWMFDYFTNIGSYLEDIFTTPAGVTRYLVQNRRFELTAENTFELVLVGNNPNGMTTLSSSPGTSEVKYLEFERTSLSQLPHAELYFKSLDSIGSFGFTKLFNLISVLAK